MTYPCAAHRLGLFICALVFLGLMSACGDSTKNEPPITDGDTAEIENETADTEETVEGESETEATEEESESEDDTYTVLAVPYLPGPYPNPLVDEPYLQEYNHTTNEVPAEMAELNGVVFTKGVEWLDDFTALLPRGIVRHNADQTIEVLPLPESNTGTLRQGAVLAGRFYAVSDSMLYVLLGRTFFPLWNLSEGTFITVRSVGGKILALADTGTLYYDPEGGIPGTPIFTPYTEGQFVATDVALVGDYVVYATIETLRIAAVAQGGLEGPYKAAALEEHPGLGNVRALVGNLTLPKSMDLVVVGENGLKAYDLVLANGANPVGVLAQPVEVAEFAATRVPYDHCTCAARASDGGLLVGSNYGAMRLMNRGDGPEWRVYNAERWLPDPVVRGLATDPDTADSPIWFATPKGPGIVTAKRVTLEEKFAPFAERIVARHDRDGAVADSHLTKKGDLSSNIPWDSDNDGSWTSYWLIGECLRYSVTKDAEAKAHFDKSLEAMLRLRDVTGTDYFVARAVIRKEGCILDDCDNPDDGRWFTSPDGKWWVKSDTSNDEVIAHIFLADYAYSVCADDTQKARIRAHVRGIVAGIIEHGYVLWDEQGEITTYGQFDPWYINVSPGGKLGDGGHRAAEMLALLNTAYHMTGEELFLKSKKELIEKEHYDVGTINDAFYTQRNNVYDMDEMYAEAILPLIRYETDPALFAKWQQAWTNEWAHLKELQMAWYSVLDYAMGMKNTDLPMLHRWLKLTPVDMIRWNVTNSTRRDLIDAPLYFRVGSLSGDRQLGKKRSDGHIIPHDERRNDRYNTDQFRVDGGMGGTVEMDGAEAYLAYWMARYYGILVPKAAK